MKPRPVQSVVAERLASCAFYFREGDLVLALHHLETAQRFIPYLQPDMCLRACQLAEALGCIGMEREGSV